MRRKSTAITRGRLDRKVWSAALEVAEELGIGCDEIWQALSGHGLTTATEDEGITDRDREVFSQGWCWELAAELALLGHELAIVAETVTNYLGEPEEDYPHCFVIDGKGKALDIHGRSSLGRILTKWCRDPSQAKILRGREAEDLMVGVRLSDAGRRAARKIIAQNPVFFR